MLYGSKRYAIILIIVIFILLSLIVLWYLLTPKPTSYPDNIPPSNAIQMAKQFTINRYIKESGFFVYDFNIITGKKALDDNIVRQMGALFILSFSCYIFSVSIKKSDVSKK